MVGVLLLQLGFILSYVGAFHAPDAAPIAARRSCPPSTQAADQTPDS